jgi:phosphodiesterase/alkaline phosphatase D-like protein
MLIFVATAVWTVSAISSWHFRLPEASVEPTDPASPVYMASGMKIGEVTSDSTIVWTRLTRDPEADLETKWGRVATGTPGQVRLSYWPDGNEALTKETSWYAVDTDKDFTRQLHLAELTPATDYSLKVVHFKMKKTSVAWRDILGRRLIKRTLAESAFQSSLARRITTATTTKTVLPFIRL